MSTVTVTVYNRLCVNTVTSIRLPTLSSIVFALLVAVLLIVLLLIVSSRMLS